MKKKDNKIEGKKRYIWIFIILSIICLLLVFRFVLWPTIEKAKVNRICNQYGKGWKATYYTEFEFDCPPGSQCDYYKWSCCPSTGDKNGCIGVETFDISDFK